MALIGKAAMILSFDIESSAIDEHDNWHNHEHLPERLSIPGFRRSSRWVAQSGSPRYFVMYEVAGLDTLASPPYLERLNNPSAWTARMMPHYRHMRRGFCRVVCSRGLGLGTHGLLIHFSPEPGRETALRDWLVAQALPALPGRPRLASAHLFEAALTPEMTREQRIRGKDDGVDWVVLVTGYDESAVAGLAEAALSPGELERRGGINIAAGGYRMGHALFAQEAVLP